MEIFALLLTVLALLLSLWQTYLARKQMRDAKEQTQNISQIRASMSTRFIGEFPVFVPNIVSLIERAETKISICCDFPTYGFVSDHANWRKYRLALEEAIDRGVSIDIIILNEKHRNSLNKEQFFKNDADWNRWKKDVNNIETIEKIFPSIYSKDFIKNLSQDFFISHIESEDKKVISETFSRANVIEVDTPIPLLYWTIDDSQAIFSFAPISETVIEHGFVTFDKRLIEVFSHIGERYQRVS